MTAEEYLDLGLSYIKEKNWTLALNALLESRKRYAEGSSKSIPPRLLSALGVSLAMADNKIDTGLGYCRRALVTESQRPEFYYHLGLVYLKGGKKAKAVSSFHTGLMLNPTDPEITAQLAQMGVRKKPVVSFLKREHFLNKFLGTLLAEPEKKKKTGRAPTRKGH